MRRLQENSKVTH